MKYVDLPTSMAKPVLPYLHPCQNEFSLWAPVFPHCNSCQKNASIYR